jgi:TctA family transporter
MLALVLGPQLETNFRRALAVLSLTWPLLVRLARRRAIEVPVATEEL